MLLFLYGSDTYRSRQKLNEIIEEHKKIHKSGLNLKYFDAEKTTYRELQEEMKTRAMFEEKKLLVLYNAFGGEEFKKGVLENAEKFLNSRNNILFWEGKSPQKNDSLFKFLKKQAKSQEFSPLTGTKIETWIKKEFKKYSVEINSLAIKTLIDFSGNNLWRVSEEIKKLVSYKIERKIKKANPIRKGEGLNLIAPSEKEGGLYSVPAQGVGLSNGVKISKEDILLLVKPYFERDIFKIVDAIMLRNKRQALNLLYGHLEKGESPLRILSTLNYQLRNILEIKELGEGKKSYNNIVKKSRLHPYVFRKSFWQAKNFTIEELKKIYRRIFQIDLDIKTGKLNPGAALELLIAEI